jgi:hypothetical protein
MLSGTIGSYLIAVIRVHDCVYWLEQHGVDVGSDFKDRYGLFPPDRKGTGEAVFEWTLASPRDISAALVGPESLQGVVERITSQPAIRSLNLAATKISPDQLLQLSELTDLEELSLSATAIDDSSFDNLQALSHLRTLDLSETAITDASLRQIADMQSLRSVSLVKTHVTQRGLWALQRARPDLIVSPKSLPPRHRAHRRSSAARLQS